MAVNSAFRRTLPRAVRLALGAVCVVVGIGLTLRPFSSLAGLIVLAAMTAFATGAAQWATARQSAGIVDDLVAVGWVLLGLGVLAWPSLSVRGIAIAAGLGLVVAGVGDVIAGFQRGVDERVASVFKGVASVVLGVVALSWPDVTLLVVALVFGARTVLFGLSELLVAFGFTDAAAGLGRPVGRLRRYAHVTASGVALVFAVVVAVVSVRLHAGTPVVDAFYEPPSDVPNQPGELLHSESFTKGLPPNARAWRVLYTTTRHNGVGAVASALVVAPAATADKALPIIAWAHGTTGVARPCAPSLLEAGLQSSALVAVGQVVAEGWALVATDYTGLGTPGPHPYLIGEGEARSVLDAVRAAQQLEDLRLADQTVVWGHSQGGHAALWTGEIASTYAPDVHVVGVAALAPASDLPGLIDALYSLRGGSLLAAYVITAYAEAYPEVHLDDYVRATADPTVRDLAKRCLAEPAIVVSGLEAVDANMSVFKRSPKEGPLATRLVQNVPSGPVNISLLIGQGDSDPLILPAVQTGYVRGLCAKGRLVDYRTYPGRDHLSLVAADSPLLPELLGWTRALLAGEPPRNTCST